MFFNKNTGDIILGKGDNSDFFVFDDKKLEDFENPNYVIADGLYRMNLYGTELAKISENRQPDGNRRN